MDLEMFKKESKYLNQEESLALIAGPTSTLEEATDGFEKTYAYCSLQVCYVKQLQLSHGAHRK